MSVRSDSFVINRLSLRLTNFFGEGLPNSVQISGRCLAFLIAGSLLYTLQFAPNAFSQEP